MIESNAPDIALLLAEALKHAQSERAAYLARVCEGNSALRRDLDLLLAAHEQAGDFLNRAAVPTGAFQHEPAPAAAPADDVGTVIGRYRLLQLIGEGGFGSVFMAEQSEPVRRMVALKVIKLGMDTRQVVARFEAERQALAMMDHPNIARVLDGGATASGRPYFVMDLVKGIPITAYCDQNNLDTHQRLRLFIAVCQAVQHAHQKGVIHRDLKPSNVLVTLHDGVPVPMVIDFGIAKATSARLTEKTLFTEFRQLIGTPEYMSPEQAEMSGLDIDTRSDVYSLGVLLYELLTGTTPFDSGTLRSAGYAEIQRIIREVDPPRPSTRLSTMGEALPGVAARRATEPRRLGSQIRGELDWIVMKAMEKDRTRRYESASALADDVQRHIDHQPVLAGSPGAMYRFGKLVRRHRARSVAVGLIALAVITGSIGTLIGMLRARDAAAAAREEAARSLAISDFLTDVLTSVEPDERGADVRLIEVIEDASRTAPQRFADHPETEAQVRLTLARVYGRLANSRGAQAELERVLEIWRSVGGPDDPKAIAAQLGIAWQQLTREEARRAAATLDDVQPRIERTLPSNHPHAMELRRLRGMVSLMRGDYEQAEATLLAVRQELSDSGDDDRQQLEVLNGLIRSHMRRFHDEDDQLRERLLIMEPLVRELIERSSRVNGPEAHDSLDARIRLADIEWQLGRCQDSADASRAVLQTTESRYSECHPLRSYAQYVLAFALHCLGEEQEPADLWLQRIECIRREGTGSTDPIYLGAVSDSMRFLERAGRAVEGEARARELCAAFAALGGAHENMGLAFEGYLATFVSMQGRLDEAEAIFATVMPREPQDSSVFVRARLRLMLGNHRTRQGRFEDAQRELDAASALMGDARRGTYGSHNDDIVLGYITLYQQWNKPEEAARYEAMRRELKPYETFAPSTQPTRAK